MAYAKRIRLCMKDLYHQDMVEMIERETRQFEVMAVTSPRHPLFQPAFELLWRVFGAHGEMESERVVRSFLRDDPFEPSKDGTFMKYFFIVATDRDGNLRGVRDGTILLNPRYSRDLCLVYLSHIYMKPEARGTVLSYWLRIAPVEIAVNYLYDLHERGRIQLPEPERPGRYFGMRMNLAAEMEYFAPEDPISLQRILFYGRGGFDVINPKHFPYRQPDFRDPEEIAADRPRPLPFMLLLRRMGRERQAQLPIDEAAACLNLLYDDFESFCELEPLELSLDLVLDRLERRRRAGKDTVELLPLPTGPQNLHRLRPIWRYSVFRRLYEDEETREYLGGEIRRLVGANKHFWRDAIAEIADRLYQREPWVYPTRDHGFTFLGTPLPERDLEDLEDEE